MARPPKVAWVSEFSVPSSSVHLTLDEETPALRPKLTFDAAETGAATRTVSARIAAQTRTP
jgi:hypothetical protein